MLFNRVILQVAAAAAAGPLFQSVAPLQAFDPSVVFDAPAPTRAAGAFLASVVFGGLVIYRYGDRLAAAVEASTKSPLLSVLYGFIAYGLVTFLVVYAYSQFVGFGVGVSLITVVGAVYDFQDVYSGDRGEVHVINVDGERDVATLREEHQAVASRIDRLWEY